MGETDTTPLADLATMYHELFNEFCKAGFNRKEALYLVGKHLTATVMATDRTDDEDE